MKMKRFTLVLGVLFMSGVLATSMTSCGNTGDNAAKETVAPAVNDEAPAVTDDATEADDAVAPADTVEPATTDEAAKCGEGKCGEGKCGGAEEVEHKAPVDATPEAKEASVDQEAPAMK